MTHATLKNINGSPAIEVNGKVFPPMTATVTTYKVDGDSYNRAFDREYYRNLGNAGIKIYYVMCDNLDINKNGVQSFAEEAQIILDEVPDAYIMMRISLVPSEEWVKSNPEHIVTYSDGNKNIAKLASETFVKFMEGMPSLCSWKWRDDMGKTLINTLGEVMKLPFSDRIIGFFLGAGGTSEWYYVNPIENFETGVYGDLSEAFKVQYTKFLDNKYGKNTVQPIIPDASSRFYTSEVDRMISRPLRISSTAKAPAPPSNGTNYGAFLDIDKFPHTFDFYRAWHEGTAESVIYFSKLIKELYPDLLVGAFYGSMGGSEIIWASNGAGVMKILESGYVDFLANPGVYENRQPGGFTGQRVASDSFRLHNSMYMVEDDDRTHAENRYYGELAEMFSMSDTINVLKRDFGKNICNDTYGWWFDQHFGGGRYKFGEVYDLFKKQQKIAEFAYGISRDKGNEIAFIYDEESVHVASKQTTDECVQVIRNYEIANIGAPVDSYYHNDMSNEKMPNYKLYVFTNCFYLSDSERAIIKKKLSKNNATALFLYANGLINPDREKMLDVANVSEFTGIECGEIYDNYSPMFRISDNSSYPTCHRLDSRKIFGSFMKQRKPNVGFVSQVMPRSYLYPVIYPDDKNAIDIASFLQCDVPAVSVKKADGFTSVYCGTKYISADFIREVARFAGCHIYEEDGNVLFANNNFITVHASKSGSITLKAKEKCRFYELYEDKVYGEGTTKITFEAKCGDTKMFYLKR